MEQTLKKLIKDKFGTASRFCELAGLDYRKEYEYTLEKYRDQPSNDNYMLKVKSLIAIVMATKPGDLPGEITGLDRELMRRVIDTHYGSIDTFCWFHSQFNKFSVAQAINGTRKKKTKIIAELLALVQTIDDEADFYENSLIDLPF